MNRTQWKYIRLRIAIVGGVFLVLMGGIAARAVQVLVYRSSWLSQEAARQVERSYTNSGKRGSIYDTRHREIAGSVEVTSIAANPRLIKDRSACARVLAKTLHLDAKQLAANG
jgi:cell division protein FtsI (penicillin-binding protein 3)